jgi:hypothetical protein
LFRNKDISRLLDVNRAESVFKLFFLFVRDPALTPGEQLDLDEVLHDIFLGHSIPKPARKRLQELHMQVLQNPPLFNDSVDHLVRDLKGEKDALIAFTKIVLRLISDDGMISRRHCNDLRYLFQKCNFSSFDLEEFTEDEQSIVSIVVTGKRDNESIHTAPLYHSLGCAPGASVEQIKKAYRALVMKYHPDRLKFENPENCEREHLLKKFQDIQIAYNSLMRILDDGFQS